jgi:NADPH:quinone reductase-like Zn-dependent oxidoreductase
VTGVTSADKQELVRTIGADMVLDREHEDYTRNAGAYDVIIDISGDRSFGATRRALGRNGRLVVVGAHRGVLRRVLLGDLRRKLLKQDIRFFSATVSTDDLSVLRELGEAGNMSPVIDRTFSFEETAAAVAYAERQQAAGKVVVAISD